MPLICGVLMTLLLCADRACAAEPAPAPRSLSLGQAYELALKRSEELAQAGETVAQLDARIAEMWSYLKPGLGLKGSELIQDVPSDLSGLSSSAGDRGRGQVQLQLHQTLFTGLRDYLSVRQAKAQKASSEFALLRARQLLYQGTALAYLNLLAVRHQLDIQQSILATTDERIKQLLQRERIGKSRRSEVLASQSQRAQIAAQIETARGVEGVAQLQLRFLTGLEEDASPVELPQASSASLEGFLDAARARPDVEGARRDRDAAGYPVTIASRQRWPVVNFDGNYYLYRPVPQDRVKWDLTLSASLPLYTGGLVSAQVREAEAARRSADQSLSLALRRADTEVRCAHRNLESSLAIVSALVEAARLAEENSKAQADDYRSGLVANLDVLGSISTLQSARLSLEQARIQALFARAQLDVAAGLAGGRP